jgi:uncharacterized repeat protein (TIGR03837 family)
MPPAWDIFCKVVDNYGDIGVAWRLARQLAAEHGLAVRLWVDDLHAFRHIWPAINPVLETQVASGVEVRQWREPFTDVPPAQVVVEAFGCALPESYLAAMAAQSRAPVWINLEYLSAETWVAAHHSLPSPHPRLPLTKYFFFPGYESGTGGLLREADFDARRTQFAGEASAFLQALGVDADPQSALRVSMFGYENPLWPGLLRAWAAGDAKIACLVPDGRLIPQLADWLGEPGLAAGAMHRRGKLTLHVLPFLTQDDYDRLLWACDLNFVRGEDSCVRAQWARKPFVWQAYPQPDNAHRAKLDALLQRYMHGLSDDTACAVEAFCYGWNGQTQPEVARVWQDFAAWLPALTHHAENWAATLALPGDLAANLVRFVEQRACR